MQSSPRAGALRTPAAPPRDESTHARGDAEEAGPIHQAVPAAGGTGGGGAPLPPRTGSHCLLGERGCFHAARRVRFARVGGAAGPDWVLCASRHSRGTVAVAEGPGYGGWPVGTLDSPGPQPAQRRCSEAWFLRAGGSAETLVRLEGPSPRSRLSQARSGGANRLSSHPGALGLNVTTERQARASGALRAGQPPFLE